MLSSPLRFTRLSDARSGPWRRFVIALDPAMLGPPPLEDLSRGTEGLQTPRWRKPDSNLYGAFPVKSLFLVFAESSLFGAGRPFFVPSPGVRFAERAEGVKGPKR